MPPFSKDLLQLRLERGDWIGVCESKSLTKGGCSHTCKHSIGAFPGEFFAEPGMLLLASLRTWLAVSPHCDWFGSDLEVIQEPSAPHWQETAFQEIRTQATFAETSFPTSRLRDSEERLHLSSITKDTPCCVLGVKEAQRTKSQPLSAARSATRLRISSRILRTVSTG